MTIYPDHRQLVEREEEQWREETFQAIEKARARFEAMTPVEHIREAERLFAWGDSTDASVHLQFAAAKALAAK